MINSKLLSKEKQKIACDEIIRFFEEERDEEIGIIASQNVLNFFLEHIGKEIYSKGVDDSKQLVQSNLEELEFRFEELK